MDLSAPFWKVTGPLQSSVLNFRISNNDLLYTGYDDEETTTLPIKPSKAPTDAPTINVNPEATAGNSNNSLIPSAAPPPSNGYSTKLISSICALIMIIWSFFFFEVLSIPCIICIRRHLFQVIIYHTNWKFSLLPIFESLIWLLRGCI